MSAALEPLIDHDHQHDQANYHLDILNGFTFKDALKVTEPLLQSQDDSFLTKCVGVGQMHRSFGVQNALKPSSKATIVKRLANVEK